MKKTMTNRKAFELLYDYLNDKKNRTRGAWHVGIYVYAMEMVERVIDYLKYDEIENDLFNSDLWTARRFNKIILDGAYDWKEASYGGCWLIYNGDICYRLCNDTEIAKTDEGRKQPNARETWLDVQARALYQAADLLYRAHLEYQCNL